MGSDNNTANNDNNVVDTIHNLATFTTTAPCQYHRGNALTIYGLSLMHDGGRVLFQTADCTLPHGSITGVVGTNGCGKTTFAQLLASKSLDGFPVTDLMVEYLAAADDEDGHLEEETSLFASQLPREYILSRLQERLNQLRSSIKKIEQTMEKTDAEELLEALAEELSDLYDVEDSMRKSIERDTDLAMESIGLNAYGHKPLDNLSCGWRYKCRLVAAVLKHPDCLIIDEPSFLDTNSTDWLMEQLRHLARSENTIVMLISHKEVLLDALCDRIIHINSANQTLSSFHCGYSVFRKTLEAEIQHTTKLLDCTHDRLESADKSLKTIQAMCKRRETNFHKTTERNADKRFIKGKNKEAKQKADRSAASKLQKAQQAVKDAEDIKHKAKRERVKPLHIEGIPAEGTIVSLEMVGMKFDGIGTDDDWVFQNVDASLEFNDRVLLQGSNGCGKSTLAKLILGELNPTEGSVNRSTQNIVYFPQTALYQLLRLHGHETAMEYLASAKTMTMMETRHHLGDFGLAKDLALHPIKTLSAGQRVRLWLARELLLHPKPSLLILDETSENMDVETRKSLVDMLKSFGAAVLAISHDSDFCLSFSKNMTKTWRLSRHGLDVQYQE
ncbi:ABC transporter ATP-binding protein [Nitzschia inconspicua]|uniref:ABC transporter ATP-binding protein n=1 Tax=Nitzschia inconspicua TaxID=303405 RepID=A0A9K3PHV0_9STRA|nr:ABC transporter ATP-binding protein [Nitzschia inconspicua]